MEDIELKSLWKAYDQQAEQSKLLNLQSWVLQIQAKEFMQLTKAKSKLNKLSRLKTRIIFVGLVWIAVLAAIAFTAAKTGNISFTASIIIILLFNVYAVVYYIKHKVLINEIDNTDSIVEAQQKTIRLQTSTIDTTRILFLQAPFYTTWYYSISAFKNGEWQLWAISLPITILFVWLSIWLYRNINYKNAHKKWFRILFNGPEWTPISKALEFMREIEELKANEW